MTATITKIDFTRKGTDEHFYQAVYFRLEGGGSAKTHICKSMRNFRRWEHLLQVGMILKNLRMKTEKIIDADSFPKRVKQLEQGELL